MSPPADASAAAESTSSTPSSPVVAPAAAPARTIDDVPGERKHSWLSSARYIRDPYKTYDALFAQHGELVRLHTAAGILVVSGHPDGARDLFTADHDTYEVFSPELLSPFIGETSLLLVSGDRHKRDRKLLMPPFHGARMRAYGALMTEAARRHAQKLVRAAEFSVQETTQAISLEIILRAVFGITDEARVEQFRSTILDLFGLGLGPLILVPGLRVAPFGLGPWGSITRTVQRLDALIYEEINARRAQREIGDDILSLVLQMRDEQGNALSDQELRDELMTLVLAGHETTATALAWALYWVHRPENGAVLTRLRGELDALPRDAAPETIASLPYLEAVCNETLRLYPIVPDLPRKLRRPMTFQGVALEPGMGVGVCIAYIHMRPELYPEPERFRPERFLERKYSPFEFLPFGGGARRCLGAAFAQYELKLVLAALLRENYFALARAEPVGPERRGITMGPEKGVPFVWLGPREVAPAPAVSA